MSQQFLSYKDAQYFSNLMEDYLSEKEELRNLYHRFPSIDNFKVQIEEKRESLATDPSRRTTLSKALLKQYKNVKDAALSVDHIKRLEMENTFTITTGHQLNLFTGPLYFLYKIISVINLCKRLKKEYPDCHFVPIYWMATEDHDFEEIQYFNLKGKKIVWEREASGAVGRLNTQGLEDVFQVFKSQIGINNNAAKLTQLFKEAYLEHTDLTQATRYLAHQLFKDEGLVIVDGDDIELKKLMIPSFKEELVEQTSFNEVTETLKNWPQEYKIQVNPRAINLFYVTDGLRARIVRENDVYKVLNTTIEFTEQQIVEELERYPQRFSPNVILRPFYQEFILPNLCYIGGGGEMAYWLELKSYFDSQQVPFPILLMRNSALLMTQKQLAKIKKLNVRIEDLFLKGHQLQEKLTYQLSEINIDFTAQKEHLKKQFKSLYDIAQQTDQSFNGAVAAQEKKQLNGLEHLEKRLLKAQKRKLKDYLDRATLLQNDLFPNYSLQERQENFSSFYNEYGVELIELLKKSLDPLGLRFTVLVVD